MPSLKKWKTDLLNLGRVLLGGEILYKVLQFPFIPREHKQEGIYFFLAIGWIVCLLAPLVLIFQVLKHYYYIYKVHQLYKAQK